jgi:glycosyltransferase involved in cell wall biosynthesis
VTSALSQTVGDLDVIVVDDASADDTVATVSAIADRRLRLVVRPVRGGGSAARNTGIDQASGEYVAFLDSDDEWLPHYLERQLSAFARRPGAGLSCASFLVVRGNRRGKGVPGLIHGDPLTRLLALEGGPVTASGFVVARSVLDGGVRFDERLPALQDLDFAIQVAKGPRAVVGTTEVLLRKYRDADRSHVFSPRNELPARLMLLSKYEDAIAADPRSLSRHYQALARTCLDAHDLPRAGRYVRLLRDARPRHPSGVLLSAAVGRPQVLRTALKAVRIVENADPGHVRRRLQEGCRDAIRSWTARG